ncbi:MAG: DUF11 domain-containing protein [Gammaproteobacteria bacterium]|nr:DUF11 domain-containing protein [Gammaproteobacteria bacterium]NNF66649.1 DUF11 domain-containing protein [Gammaproteobacteria bacterium]
MKMLFSFIFMLFAAGGIYAGDLALQTVAEKEELVVNEQGETESRLTPITTVVPGDVVVYTITFSNNGKEHADTVMITDPVPDQMRYIEGSAFGGGTDILFSVDGAESFAQADDLVVVDAAGNTRSARAEDYTHIRWTMRNPLPPGKRGIARFKARLR